MWFSGDGAESMQFLVRRHLSKVGRSETRRRPPVVGQDFEWRASRVYKQSCNAPLPHVYAEDMAGYRAIVIADRAGRARGSMIAVRPSSLIADVPADLFGAAAFGGCGARLGVICS